MEKIQNQQVELEVFDLSSDGRGVARGQDGRIIFISGALSGEVVTAEITNRKKDYQEAVCLKVLKASSDRIEPVCPHYSECGGCNIMHLSYKAQLEHKRSRVEKALTRAGVKLPVGIIPSPTEQAYRGRVRFQIAKGALGFFAPKSHRVVDAPACKVVDPGIMSLMKSLRPLLVKAPGKWAAWLEAVGRENDIFLTVGFGPQAKVGRQEKDQLREELIKAGARGVRFQSGDRLEKMEFKAETGAVYYRENMLELRAFPGLFSQINFAGNREMISLVLTAAGHGNDKKALDLYAGCGNFSIPLMADGWQVTVNDTFRDTRDAFAFQAKQNRLESKGRFLRGDAGEMLIRLCDEKERFDLVLLDPPRAGGKGMMPGIAALMPKKIIYISCHEAALARDAKKLGEAGYNAVSLQAIDMFPHTGHVEAILVLERGNG